MSSVDTIIRSAPGESCTPELAQGPWTFDLGTPGYGPGASENDVIFGLRSRSATQNAAAPATTVTKIAFAGSRA